MQKSAISWCTRIGVAALMVLLFGAWQNETHGDRDPATMDRLIRSMRFQYGLGNWVRLSRKTTSNSNEALSLRITRWVNDRADDERLWFLLDRKISVIDSLSSRFLRSTYYLVTATKEGRASVEAFFAVDRSNDRIEFLSHKLTEVPYLELDLREIPKDSISMVEASMDIVTLLSARYPLVFLESAMDIWLFSNAVCDDEFWSTVSSDDTATKLVGSYRLTQVSSNAYFRGANPREHYSSTAFDSIAELVKIPESTTSNATLFTWSPLGGNVLCWQVELLNDGKLRVKQTTVARGLGFTFAFL